MTTPPRGDLPSGYFGGGAHLTDGLLASLLSGRARRSTAPLALWVDAVAGSDTFDGSEAKPYATIDRAVEDLPEVTRPGDPVVVWLLPGTYAPPSLPPKLLGAPIAFVGAGDPEVVATGTTTAGTTANQIVVTGGGLTVNAYKDRFLRIGTEKRLIAKNDTTTIFLAGQFSAIPANGTSFDVFRPPAVIIDFDQDPKWPLIGCSVTSPDILGEFAHRGVIWAEMRWTGTASSIVKSVCVQGLVSLYGIEVTGTGPSSFRLGNDATLRMGRTVLNPSTANPIPSDPKTAGLIAADLDWHAYGVAWSNASHPKIQFRGYGTVVGQWNCNAFDVGAGTRATYYGGRISGLATGESVIVGGSGFIKTGPDAGSGSGARAELHLTATLGDFFEILGNTTDPCVLVQGDATCSYSNTNADIIAGAGQVGVFVQQAAAFYYLDGDIFGGSGSYSLRVWRGGRAFLIDDAADEIMDPGGGGARFAAGSTPTTKNTTFTVVGETLKETNYADYDGSFIVRVS